MEMPRGQYTTNQEDFERSREIAKKMLPELMEETKGHFLIGLQALDFLQDAIQGEAIAMKAALEGEGDHGQQEML